MNAVNRILGEDAAAEREKIHRDAWNAYQWAIHRRCPYPQGEPAMAKDPLHAYMYAIHVIKRRFHEAEQTIAKSDFKNAYLKRFPDAEDDWRMNGWIEGEWL